MAYRLSLLNRLNIVHRGKTLTIMKMTSNGLMPAVGELMMLSRLLIIPGLAHAVQIIGVNLCSLVLRTR